MQQKNSQKVIIIPTGLLSLIILPAMIFLFLFKYSAFHDVRTMEINLPQIKESEPFLTNSHKSLFYTPVLRNSKIAIHINNIQLQDNSIWNIVSIYVYDLIKNRDSVNCLVVSLDSTVAYKHYVELEDRLQMLYDSTYNEGCIRYSWYKGKIYVVFLPIRKYDIVQPWFCGNAFIRREEPMKSRWEVFQEYISGSSNLVIQNKPASYLLFGGIVFMSVFEIYRKNRSGKRKRAV